MGCIRASLPPSLRTPLLTTSSSRYSKLANAVPQALEAIKELGLDELGPLGEKIFPVPEQDRITLIDQVIALD